MQRPANFPVFSLAVHLFCDTDGIRIDLHDGIDLLVNRYYTLEIHFGDLFSGHLALRHQCLKICDGRLFEFECRGTKPRSGRPKRQHPNARGRCSFEKIPTIYVFHIFILDPAIYRW